MPHFPLNHPLRPLYRALGGLTGAYVLLFGIVGLTRSVGDGLFARDGVWVFGMRTNLAYSIICVVIGVVVLAANALGGGLAHRVNQAASVLFLIAGIGMLSALQTEVNFLNFSVTTVVVSLVFGLVLLLASMYDKIGTSESAEAERVYRRSSTMPDPDRSAP